MPLTPLNYINTGKDGALTGTTTQQLDEMFAAFAGKQKIVLHFHGGLVDRDSGIGIAERLCDTYETAGAYPIFFVWESGLLEIVPRNLAEIFGEDIFQIILKRVLQYAVGKLDVGPGGRAIGAPKPTDLRVAMEIRRPDGREPFAEKTPTPTVEPLAIEEEAEFSTMLSEDPEFNASAEAIALGNLPGAAGGRGLGGEPAKTLMSPEVVDELTEGAAGTVEGGRAIGLVTTVKLVARAVKILARVISRFRSQRDHGVYPTVVEEILRELYVANIGANVWAAMKQETQDSFAMTVGRGGTGFLDRLAAQLQAAGPAAYPEITLIGHSTGAVFIDHLLDDVLARQQAGTFPADFSFRQILLLAPANTMTRFASTLDRCRALFRGLRIFGMQDTVESNDVMVPVVYPRSLLYFVSGLLETDETGAAVVDMPLVGMERFYTREDVYADAATARVRSLTSGGHVWSITSGAAVGLSSASAKHGDFDNDELTVASLAAMIATPI